MQQPDKDRIATLYNDTIQIKFVETNHSYWVKHKVDGEWPKNWTRAPGATTIIGIMDKSGALVPWAVKLFWRHLKGVLLERPIDIYDLETGKGLHRERKETAATSGSRVHDWIEQYTKGFNPELPEDPAVLNGVLAFKEWEKQEGVHIIGSETLLYSKKYGFCGQADFIFYRDNPLEIYLGDYKTSNGLYSGVMMQTASYLRGIEEMGLEYAEWTDAAWLSSVNLKDVKFVGRYALRLEKRSEEEFQRDMEEKGKMDIPYEIFEYINLDPESPGRDYIEEDFQGFLCARGLREWSIDAEERLLSYRT